jgi:hypothetical protein
MNTIGWEHGSKAPDTVGERRGHPALWSACGLVFAAIVAAEVYMNLQGGLLFCTSERTHGANIEHALGLAFYGAIAGTVVIPFVRKVPRVLAAVLLLAAGTLGAAMVFVALDSATYVGTNSCGIMDTTDTTVNDRLYYLFVLWGVPLAILVSFAIRLLLPRRCESAHPGRQFAVRAGVTAVVVAALVYAVSLSDSRPASNAVAASGSRGVLVCKNPIRAPEALGGPWVCASDSDIGRAPIRRPDSLMCTTDLSGVENKAIGVQVLYGTTMIEHGTLHSSDATASPYAEFDGSYVDGVGNGDRLPAGVYRCRFLVGGKLVGSRTITVGSARLAHAPARYHYALDVERPKAGVRVTRTHLGDEFTIRISSRDLPRGRMAMVDLCVNHVRGAACYSFFVTGRTVTNVVWDVSRGEGRGRLYRLTIRVRGHQLAGRDLQLVRRA